MPKIPTARDHGHTHGEAFMLMRYACQECGKNQMVWNSRDGVTPFMIGCPRTDCAGMMNHVDWRGDIYAPDYVPDNGERFFRDGTPDEAVAIMQKRIENMRDEYPLTPEEERDLIDRARKGDDEFQKGWPTVALWGG